MIEAVSLMNCMDTALLEIIYQDEYLVAINKPHGMLVHRSWHAKDAKVFALQTLRNQLGRHVFPAHRLDRKTGGVLLFSFNSNTARLLQEVFEQRAVSKTYWAIVRGHTDDAGTIDYPLRPEDHREQIQDATTHYTTLQRAEAPWPSGQFSTSRYSWIMAAPTTGRMHQIRKHFAHIRHPIVADRPHGCNKQNRIFKERFHMDTMLLHAYQLELIHPVFDSPLRIKAPPQAEFKRSMKLIGFE